MKQRWLIYIAIGTLFGTFDFVYLGFLAKFHWGGDFSTMVLPDGSAGGFGFLF